MSRGSNVGIPSTLMDYSKLGAFEETTPSHNLMLMIFEV